MRVTFDWTQLAAAVGALQGLLLVGALVAHNEKRTANRLLAALMAAFTLYLVSAVYYSASLVEQYPHFFGISYPLPWLFGPLVFLYALTASDDDRRLRARDALHFAPVIVVVVACLPIYFLSGAEKIAMYERLRGGNVPTVIAVLDPSKYVSGIAYAVATIAYLRVHARRVEQSYSNTERVNLLWLRWMTGAAAAIWLLAVGIRIADLAPMTSGRSTDLVALPIALFVYAIGYIGLRQPEIYRYEAQPPPPPPQREETRYERSGLSNTEAEAVKKKLLELMTREHPHRDPDLTLPQLAEQLDTTPHKLSEVLNGELAQTFYDFVNSYRVNDVRRRLTESKSAHLSVLTLAMDAGFASKSTFNQVFKKVTGQTPSSYRKALLSS